ncbi:uncharacterized protein LOC107361594 [Tetranychus urticae]|uniref:F-box domain-containing protein n=1 Tax=Tetranychus urticae TaxID=32264 RepID=T1K8U5_TETUR|nr:uncharacterized protein LOC107361594 [Tetranychus urticae]
MFINELPEECLLAIFDEINHIKDLMNCFKVCIKWNHLIAERTKKVKYLIENNTFNNGNLIDLVYYEEEDQIDVACLSILFPNLKIAEFSCEFEKKVQFEDIVTLVKNQESLKGLIHYSLKPIEEHCDKLEIISSSDIEPCILRNGSCMKQLIIMFGDPTIFNDFIRAAYHLPNLERLHIHMNDSYYNGPVLENLKILELNLSPFGIDICHAFQFMDSCPNLQSVYIHGYPDQFDVDVTLKLKCLQDLVISVGIENRIEKNGLARLLMKFPNLKHLALRDGNNIQDEHIERLVPILPNLLLLDVTKCRGVTQRAADYVKDYCKRYGRSIKFYFNENRMEIISDWPHLSTKREKISRGFDFMKHCFLKNYYSLPYILIPIDF